jgi:hypothetical protein
VNGDRSDHVITKDMGTGSVMCRAVGGWVCRNELVVELVAVAVDGSREEGTKCDHGFTGFFGYSGNTGRGSGKR